MLCPYRSFFSSTLCPCRRFFPSTLFPVDVFLMFCPRWRFLTIDVIYVQSVFLLFDVWSRLTIFLFYLSSHSTFFPFGVFLLTLCPSMFFTVGSFLHRRFVGESKNQGARRKGTKIKAKKQLRNTSARGFHSGALQRQRDQKSASSSVGFNVSTFGYGSSLLSWNC